MTRGVQHFCKTLCPGWCNHIATENLRSRWASVGQGTPASHVNVMICLRTNCNFSTDVSLYMLFQKLLFKRSTADSRILSTTYLTLFTVLLSIIVQPLKCCSSRQQEWLQWMMSVWGFGSLLLCFTPLFDYCQVTEAQQVRADNWFDPWIKIWMTSLIVLSSLSFVYIQRWLRVSLLGSQGGGGKIQSVYLCEWFIITGKNNSKIGPSFYSQDLLGFNSLSRDWILKF